MSTLINMWSDEPTEAEEEQQIFSGKLVKKIGPRDLLGSSKSWGINVKIGHD